MKEHTRHRKDEPGKVSASEIWKYIEAHQQEAIRKRNNIRFRESCLSGNSRILHTWNRTETKQDEHGVQGDNPYTLELRYDSADNILGGWDSRGTIMGDRVLSGYRPIDELPPFFSDELVVPCRDARDAINLVEFRPDNYAFYSTTEPRHFSITKPEEIADHGSIKNVDGRQIDYYLTSE